MLKDQEIDAFQSPSLSDPQATMCRLFQAIRGNRVLNLFADPVRAGLVWDAVDWPWRSYRATLPPPICRMEGAYGMDRLDFSNGLDFSSRLFHQPDNHAVPQKGQENLL